jgi:methylenetetrahydrofolate reductase (NADPH)
MRYETMPFGKGEQEAQEVGKPLTLTVTCSPKHGIDHSVDVGSRLRAMGHTIVIHVAARMVRSEQHADELLSRMHEADIHDVFLVGGDHGDPLGPYTRGLDLLPVMREHPLAPRTLGVPAYPEGHPMIDAAVLKADLKEKAPLADYMATQMCFHPKAIVSWLEETREDGVQLPAYIGVPGMVDRARLLEISLRVGVGTSVSFLRKQHGAIGRLLGGGKHAAEHLNDELAPMIGGDLGVAGFHIFTFNRLIETVSFIESRSAARSSANVDGQRS